MKHTLLLAMLAFPISACVSYSSVENPPQEIQRRIVSENLLTSGDVVRVVTQDGRARQFRIAEVDLDQRKLTGEDDEVVRIEEVIALEKRELSRLKTGLLIGGVVLGSMFGCGSHCGDGVYHEK